MMVLVMMMMGVVMKVDVRGFPELYTPQNEKCTQFMTVHVKVVRLGNIEYNEFLQI